MTENPKHDHEALASAIVKATRIAQVMNTGGGCLATIASNAQNGNGEPTGRIVVITELDGPWVVTMHPSLDDWWECPGHEHSEPEEIAAEDLSDEAAFPLIIAKVAALLDSPTMDGERLTTAEDPGAALADFVLTAGIEIGLDCTPGGDDDHAKDFGLGVTDWRILDGNRALVRLDNGDLVRVVVQTFRATEEDWQEALEAERRKAVAQEAK